MKTWCDTICLEGQGGAAGSRNQDGDGGSADWGRAGGIEDNGGTGGKEGPVVPEGCRIEA